MYAQRGFTLLEILVVLLIIGITAGGASVLVRRGADDLLRTEAQRLAVLFAQAQNQARASGQTIAWRPQEDGYEFVRLPARINIPAAVAAGGQPRQSGAFGANSALRPRQWPMGLQPKLSLQPGPELLFDGDLLPAPLRLGLRAGAHEVLLVRDGAGGYRVVAQ